jgi:hypothetical protein
MKARLPICRPSGIHRSENRGVEMREVLSADIDELFALYDVFIDDDEYLKPDHANGIGFNVMYFAKLELVPTWRGKRIEEALVRRVADTWGEGCAIAVVPLDDDVERWREIGFQAPAPQYAFLDLSLAHPEVVAADDDGNTFRVSAGDYPVYPTRNCARMPSNWSSATVSPTIWVG